MKNLTKLPLYRQQVCAVLTKLKLTPLMPIDNILKDQTRSSYSSFVEDQKKNKYFIKIRTSDSAQQKEFFFQSYWFGRMLNKHKPPLYQLTPKMVLGDLGDNCDYLLYEYVEGKNMGSRVYHDVLKLKKEDLSNVVKIYNAIREIPPDWFPQRFRRRGAKFYRFLILEDVPFDERTLAGTYTDKELVRIKALTQDKNLLNLLNKYTNTFQHGDFQAPNFFKIKNGQLFILDFDQCSLTNPFYDAVYLYTHAFRKPYLRNKLLNAFINFKSLTEKEQIIFYFTSFCPAFVWVKIYLRKLKRKEKAFKQQRDFVKWHQGYESRVQDTKELLNKISNF